MFLIKVANRAEGERPSEDPAGSQRRGSRRGQRRKAGVQSQRLPRPFHRLVQGRQRAEGRPQVPLRVRGPGFRGACGSRRGSGRSGKIQRYH